MVTAEQPARMVPRYAITLSTDMGMQTAAASPVQVMLVER